MICRQFPTETPVQQGQGAQQKMKSKIFVKCFWECVMTEISSTTQNSCFIFQQPLSCVYSLSVSSYCIQMPGKAYVAGTLSNLNAFWCLKVQYGSLISPGV